MKTALSFIRPVAGAGLLAGAAALLTGCGDSPANAVAAGMLNSAEGTWFVPSEGSFYILDQKIDGTIEGTQISSAYESPLRGSRNGLDLIIDYSWGSSSAGSYSRGPAGHDWDFIIDRPEGTWRIPNMMVRFEDMQAVELLRGSATSLPEGEALSPERVIEMAAEVLDRDPENTNRRLVYLQALTIAGRYGEFERRLRDWEEDLRAEENPLIKYVVDDGYALLRSRELVNDPKNIGPMLKEIEQADLDERLRLIRSVPGGMFNTPERERLYEFGVPNFLDAQVTNKVANTYAIFSLAEGDLDKALELGIGSYRIGQAFNEGGSLISVLIGVALRAISSRTLTIWATDAPVTETELEEFLRLTGEVIRDDQEHSARPVMDYAEPVLREIPAYANELEAGTRRSTSDARMALAHAAGAARLALMRDRTPVPSPEELTEPQLVRDPFADGPLLSFDDGQEVLIWSIGPDEESQEGQIEYDPTNGTVSAGDITATVRRQRKYPFPRRGLGGMTYAEIQVLMKEGFPADSFADTRGKSLGLVHTNPVTLMSFGPDVDQQEGMQNRPEVRYDPTNGTVSQGDLFIRLD